MGITGIFLALRFCTTEKATLTSLPDPERTIVFEDNAFEETVRDYFFLGEGDILWKDIGYRTRLDWWERVCAGRITSLDDLKWFTNLEQVSLNNGDINSNFSSISSLMKLKTLSLERTGIVGNINHLAGLENLRRLVLTGTGVRGDINSFSEHESIEEVILRVSHDE